MERYDENIVRLLGAYLTGRLDEEGRKVLEAWCGEDARNRAFSSRCAGMGRLLGRIRFMLRWMRKGRSAVSWSGFGGGKGVWGNVSCVMPPC